MEQVKELLPCPFCGEEAKVCEGQDYESIKVFYVECRSYCCQHRSFKYTPEEAIKKWNTRTTTIGMTFGAMVKVADEALKNEGVTTYSWKTRDIIINAIISKFNTKEKN